MEGAKKSTDYFIANANEALEIKLVRQLTDIDEDTITFKPEMTHQVFGDSETIYGYRDLKIKLYYTASALTTYLGMSYSAKVDINTFDGVEADDVLGQISKVVEPGFLTNLDDFLNSLNKDKKFLPYGELLHSFTTEEKNGTPVKEYVVYQCDVKVPGFIKFHSRLQTFIMWYIDAASFIDIDDDKWRFFVAYEKYKDNGDTMYAVAGYATIYEYYAYPNNIRPRIGQILVIPPFQKQGVAAHILTAIYQHYVPQSNVIDITVESPSEEFQRVRDYVDAKKCKDLVNGQSEIFRDGFNKKIENLFSPLKLSKKQRRRMYETLRLQFTDTKNESDYKQYRLDVKKRLNIPYQKEQADLKKLERVLNVQEYKATLSFVSPELRMENLEREYRELEAQYQHTLERLTTN